MHRRRFVATAATAPAMLATALPVLLPAAARAHHGWSSFDLARPLYLEGRADRVAWRNPHAEMDLVRGADLALPADLATRPVPAQTASVDGAALLRGGAAAHPQRHALAHRAGAPGAHACLGRAAHRRRRPGGDGRLHLRWRARRGDPAGGVPVTRGTHLRPAVQPGLSPGWDGLVCRCIPPDAAGRLAPARARPDRVRPNRRRRAAKACASPRARQSASHRSPTVRGPR